MTQINPVYHNIERKKELFTLLREQYQFQLAAAEKLEDKAWELLRVASSTFGIVSGLIITLLANKLTLFSWLGLVVILVLYYLLVREVLSAIEPRQWALIPGQREGEKLSFEELLDKYLFYNPNENDYLNQLIADLAGNDDIYNPGNFKDGAIQKIEKNNIEKSNSVRNASKLLALIIACLILLATATVVA